MSQNPYQPPLSHLASTSGHAPPDPATAEAIRKRIRDLNNKSLAFGALGLGMQVAGRVAGGLLGSVLALGGVVTLVYGLSLYARMRRQSPWWGFAGVLSCIGIAILFALPKKCHHCGATTSGTACRRCGAPAPH